jgi:hypothetical protein
MGSRDVSCQIGLLIARYRVIHGGKINIRLDGVGERQGSFERRHVVDDIDFPTFTILTMILSLSLFLFRSLPSCVSVVFYRPLRLIYKNPFVNS